MIIIALTRLLNRVRDLLLLYGPQLEALFHYSSLATSGFRILT